MKPFFLAGAILIVVSSAFATPAADSVEALTGAHTKMVWQQHSTHLGDWDATKKEYSLMGFDTRGNTPGVTTTIVLGPACVVNPKITPDGNQVTYSDIVDTKKVWIVNWDGTGKTALVDGFGLLTWKDPVTNQVWLYLSNYYLSDNPTFGVKRVRLDDLSIREDVWSTTEHWEVDWRFSLSRDGLYAAAAIKWPAIYFLDLKAGTKTKITEGCNQQIAPDNSYRMFNFESGNHKEIAMWGPKGAGPKTMIDVEFAGTEDAWAPRFSNSKAEIMTVNSPISASWGTNLYIAKFNADFTGIASKVTIPAPPGFQKTSAHAWIAEGQASGLNSKETLIARGAPVLQGLQLQLPGSGVYAIDIFTPRGAQAGSFISNASGTFDLSKAGLSNGLYQIRVRAGADIFWLKAPVVR